MSKNSPFPYIYQKQMVGLKHRQNFIKFGFVVRCLYRIRIVTFYFFTGVPAIPVRRSLQVKNLQSSPGKTVTE